MKNYLFSMLASLLAVFSASALVACSSGGDSPAEKQDVLIVSMSSANFKAKENLSQTFTIISSAAPKLTTDGQDWYSVSAGASTPSASNLSTTVTVTVKENTTTESRSGVVTISCGSKSVTFGVNQLPGEKAPEPEKTIDYSNALQIKDLPSSISGSAADAITFAESLGLGWNLGNHMDAYNNGVAGETAWGNPKATQETFNKIKAAGVSWVRIPITWLGKFGPAPTYTIDEAWLNRVYEIVEYCENAGLKALINIHHDGADSKSWLNIKSSNAANYDAIKEQIAAMWTQIANKFKDKGDFLIFEPFNEIHDGGWGWGDNTKDGGKQYQAINAWNQAFVDAVRATGGKNATRYLAVVGYSANSSLTMENLKIPTDAADHKLIVGVHFYDPTSYTLENKFMEWGHTGAKGKKETWGDEDNMKSVFQKLKDKYVSKGYPVYIGESGNSYKKDSRAEQFRMYYFEYMCKVARENGLAIALWDNGSKNAGAESHGYFDHGTGAFINNAKDAIEAMVHGFYTNDPAYTLDYIYNNKAPK